MEVMPNFEKVVDNLRRPGDLDQAALSTIAGDILKAVQNSGNSVDALRGVGNFDRSMMSTERTVERRATSLQLPLDVWWNIFKGFKVDNAADACWLWMDGRQVCRTAKRAIEVHQIQSILKGCHLSFNCKSRTGGAYAFFHFVTHDQLLAKFETYPDHAMRPQTKTCMKSQMFQKSSSITKPIHTIWLGNLTSHALLTDFRVRFSTESIVYKPRTGPRTKVLGRKVIIWFNWRDMLYRIFSEERLKRRLLIKEFNNHGSLLRDTLGEVVDGTKTAAHIQNRLMFLEERYATCDNKARALGVERDIQILRDAVAAKERAAAEREVAKKLREQTRQARELAKRAKHEAKNIKEAEKRARQEARTANKLRQELKKATRAKQSAQKA